MAKYTRICPVCKKRFTTEQSQRKCCSNECSDEKRHATAKEYQRRIRARELKNKAQKFTSKKKNADVVDIAVKAKAAGMSYGQYVGIMAMKGMT